MSDFYSSNYREMFYARGVTSRATSLIHKALERDFNRNTGHQILEVGGGEGFHVPYVTPDFHQYILLDLQKRELDETAKKYELLGKLTQVVASGDDLPYPDASFDRIIFMCVLHHLEKIDSTLMEARRVLKSGGCISVYLPCDPGFTYRLLRRLITWKRQRELDFDYETLNAFEHRNHISSLIRILKFFFSQDLIIYRWRPIPLPFWNTNLYCIIRIQKS
jgi:phosphatidylethanolamine/phosphatidyl-N-methylethanolamine N-methyltransferase